ncbi:hypothetical protein EB093_08150 [bacterium]|nr:hypothetical protein [bacterium]
MVTGGGNVGIGTSTPATKLDVVGDLRVSGNTYASYTSFTPSGSGLKWIRIPYNSQNAGGLPIHFYVTRSIFDNASTPYGGPTLEVKGFGREWHSGQQYLIGYYGYHGVAGAEITHAAVRDNASGGYYIYLRVTGGVTYKVYTAADSTPLGVPEDNATGAPTAADIYALATGINIIGDTAPNLYVAGNVGIGNPSPAYKLDVNGTAQLGQTRLSNSDLYFTNTAHTFSGIGETSGYAAIENASDYNALMILGRSGSTYAGYSRRVVRLWDYLEVNGSLTALGNITNGGFDFMLGNSDQVNRGNSGSSRALVKDGSATLVVNYANDFGGGVRVDSDLAFKDSGDGLIYKDTASGSSINDWRLVRRWRASDGTAGWTCSGATLGTATWYGGTTLIDTAGTDGFKHGSTLYKDFSVPTSPTHSEVKVIARIGTAGSWDWNDRVILQVGDSSEYERGHGILAFGEGSGDGTYTGTAECYSSASPVRVTFYFVGVDTADEYYGVQYVEIWVR